MPHGGATGELVRRALAGDREAMRQLFADVICPVVERRLAHRLALGGADRSALQDHVQEVLVHLLERDAEVLRRWDPLRGLLEPFVAKVADNHLISHLRKRPPEQGAAFSHTVLHLLRELTDGDAALFRAVYLEELSPEEAAVLLGITLDAAHKRIQRLRFRLTDMLSNPGELGT